MGRDSAARRGGGMYETGWAELAGIGIGAVIVVGIYCGICCWTTIGEGTACKLLLMVSG